MADFEKTLKTSWNGSALGSGTIETYGFTTEVAIPHELGGSGLGAGPMDLLVGSATACFVMTLVAMLEGRKIPVDELTVETQASNLKDSGLSIAHQVNLKLSASGTDAQLQTAHGLFAKADTTCYVGNMLRKAGARIEASGTVAM